MKSDKKQPPADTPEHERYLGALLEDMNSKYDAILEYVKDIPDMKEKLDLLDTRVGSIEERLDSIERVATLEKEIQAVQG
jgi:hypothetical protein